MLTDSSEAASLTFAISKEKPKPHERSIVHKGKTSEYSAMQTFTVRISTLRPLRYFFSLTV